MSNLKTIHSRFGSLVLNLDKTILFPRGIIGYPDYSYCLTTKDGSKGYLFLQSLQNDALCFILRPLVLEELYASCELIAKEDLYKAYRDYEMSQEEGMVFLMTCVVSQQNQQSISFNLKAPVLIDMGTRIGYQHVFEHKKYDMSYKRATSLVTF